MMHAKLGLRVATKWMIAGSVAVVTAAIKSDVSVSVFQELCIARFPGTSDFHARRPVIATIEKKKTAELQ